MTSTARKVVVLGGGVSGLSFSHYLNKLSHDVLSVKGAVKPEIILLEKTDTVGGWMTSHTDHNTGATFENGPRSLRAVGPQAMSALALAEEMGLTDKVINAKRADPAGKNRFIYANNCLNPLPTGGLLSLFKKQPLLGRSILSTAFKEMGTPASNEMKGKDESIHSFMSRRLGTKVADYFVDPMFRGIIAGDIRQTSIMALLPRVKATEDLYGSVILNMRKVPENVTGTVKNSALCRRALDEKWVMWSLDGGLGTLPTAMYNSLVADGVDVRLNSPCLELEKSGDKMKVHTANDCIEADMVVSTTNSKCLSTILTGVPQVTNILSTLPAAHVATVCLEYPISPKDIPQAFGHLTTSVENEQNLGVIYDSVIFPQLDRKDKSTTRLTCMIGGAWFDDILGSNPSLEQIENIAIESIAKQVGIKVDPVTVSASILWDAIPQYPVGHVDTRNHLFTAVGDSGLPLILLGPSYDHPGASHCIHLAKVQAHQLLDNWDQSDYLAAISEKQKSR